MSKINNRPNIIYIMADDMGYGDVNCYNSNSKIPTPNMDKLTKEGVIFTDCHSPSAVCTPTRYGVLTGRYCWRSRLKKEVLFGYEPPLIEEDITTIASLLKTAGYKTGCIGKWHLGLGFPVKDGESIDFDLPLPWPDKGEYKEIEEKIDFSKPLTGGPINLGFDYFFGTSSAGTCIPPYTFIENDRFLGVLDDYYNNPVFTARPGIMSRGWKFKDVDPIVTNKAVQYIEKQAECSEPFFLYFCSSAPHEPCVESFVPEFARGKSKAGPRGDLVWLFDWMVGRIVGTLERVGIADNTLLIVTSDNGALPGDRIVDKNGEIVWNIYGHRSCGDWKGYKSHIWEGGHREPFLVKWPGHIKAGTKAEDLICLTDVMATCSDISGVEIPKDAAEDSFSFLPILLGETNKKGVRDSVILHSFHGVFSIRKGDWKLIHETLGSGGFLIEAYGSRDLPHSYGEGPVKGSKGQLYNLKDDPEEKNNLYDEYPEIVKELTHLLEENIEEERSENK